MIVMSIMLPTTPNQLKIARLYLLSDILANSSNALPGAWKYRSAFEEKLLHVFDHFNLVIQSFPGRMKAEAFRRQIVNVLNHWEALLVFTPSVLAEYTKRLMTGGQAAEDLEGAPMEDADMVEAAPKPVKAGFRNIKAPRPEGEELDGAPMEEDLDGEMI
jgi:U2-associated protein SR140